MNRLFELGLAGLTWLLYWPPFAWFFSLPIWAVTFTTGMTAGLLAIMFLNVAGAVIEPPVQLPPEPPPGELVVPPTEPPVVVVEPTVPLLLGTLATPVLTPSPTPTDPPTSTPSATATLTLVPSPTPTLRAQQPSAQYERRKA